MRWRQVRRYPYYHILEKQKREMRSLRRGEGGGEEGVEGGSGEV
jgi:hypothetical protein